MPKFFQAAILALLSASLAGLAEACAAGHRWSIHGLLDQNYLHQHTKTKRLVTAKQLKIRLQELLRIWQAHAARLRQMPDVRLPIKARPRRAADARPTSTSVELWTSSSAYSAKYHPSSVHPDGQTQPEQA